MYLFHYFSCMKSTLFIAATHGNEPIGVNALRVLEARGYVCEWIVGNPRALALGMRAFEGDLNRSAPGDLTSPLYASRRAAEILAYAEGYSSVIDIHGTSANTGIFLIITNKKWANLELALRLNVRNVVVWPSFSPELAGPLSEYFSCGLEIECGSKTSPLVQEELVTILEDFLAQDARSSSAMPVDERAFYEVYGSLQDATKKDLLAEFCEVTIDGETFIPLLIQEYAERQGTTCYKMRRVQDPQSLFVK